MTLILGHVVMHFSQHNLLTRLSFIHCMVLVPLSKICSLNMHVWTLCSVPLICAPVFMFSSVQFNHSVVSNSLRPHEPQHARPPCPSPTPGVYPNPCPLSRWCHPTISSLLSPSPPALNLSQHQLLQVLLLLSRFSHVWLFATPWTAAYQALLSVGFSRQE